MKALRKFLDKIKPNFEKGKKLHFFHSSFEAFETFLFVPNTVTQKGSHIRDSHDMKRNMITVIFALIPAMLFGMWNVGYQHNLSIGETATLMQNFWFGFLKLLPIIVVSYVAGLSVEFISAQIRGHEVNEGFLVTGLLIPLIVPVDTPLWTIAIATVFAVIIGKEVFGGTGMNIVNPALLTRAFLFFAYPSKMSGDKVWIEGVTKGENLVDGFTGATPLGQAISENFTHFTNAAGQQISTSDLFFGFIPGSIGETSVLAILLGAALLIYTGVGSWKIMLSALIGGTSMAILFELTGIGTMHLPFYQHLFLGGFAFGIVFMATDPVSAAQTETGKWIYGFLIGIFALIVRVLNPAYPEGVMLAILLMNVFSPLIDHYVIEANVKRRLTRAKIEIIK